MAGYTVVDYKQVVEDIKKSYEAMEDTENVPDADVVSKIKETIGANPDASFVLDGLPGTEAATWDSLLDFLGIPDWSLKLEADEAIRKRRWCVRNEAEEPDDEAIAAIPDNTAALEEHLKAKYAEVAEDRYRALTVDSGTTEAATASAVAELFQPKVVLLVHDKRFVSDTPASNVAIKYNLLYLPVYQLIKEEIEKRTVIGQDLEKAKRPKGVNMFDIENDEFDEENYSAAHFPLELVVELLKKTVAEKRGSQKFVLISGLCNNSILTEHTDKLETRNMDELLLVEREIGEIVGVTSF